MATEDASSVEIVSDLSTLNASKCVGKAVATSEIKTLQLQSSVETIAENNNIMGKVKRAWKEIEEEKHSKSIKLNLKEETAAYPGDATSSSTTGAAMATTGTTELTGAVSRDESLKPAVLPMAQSPRTGGEGVKSGTKEGTNNATAYAFVASKPRSGTETRAFYDRLAVLEQLGGSKLISPRFQRPGPIFHPPVARFYAPVARFHPPRPRFRRPAPTEPSSQTPLTLYSNITSSNAEKQQHQGELP